MLTARCMCIYLVLQIGQVYMDQGNLEAALSTYMEALENSPDNPEILTTLGITFLRCVEGGDRWSCSACM